MTRYKLFGKCDVDGKRHLIVREPTIRIPGIGSVLPSSKNPILMCNHHAKLLQAHVTKGKI